MIGPVLTDPLRFAKHLLFPPTGRRNIVICTTSIISGNRMMDAAVEKGTFEKEAPRAHGTSE